MFAKTKKSIVTFLAVIIAALLFFVGALMLAPQQTAYAYNSSNIPKGNNVIAIHDGTKFDAAELKTLATTAGYTDLNAMMSAATESGTAIAETAETLKGKVVQLGVDRTVGGSALKWAPVYLSRSTDGDAILTLWLATDIYRSSWSDGTYSLDSNAPQTWNDKAIYSDTYDGSFIRHKLNGKTGWTTNWGSTNSEANPNANIGTMVSDFYGNGALASYIATPAKVSWQKNTHKMKNDPNWDGSGSLVKGTKANYPCDWLNDNVWLPSMYEVYDSSIPDDYSSNTFTADGGLWGVSKTGDIVSSTDGAWLRSGYPNHCANPFFLVSYGNHSYGNVFRNIGVRPALHLNLSKVADTLPKPFEVTVGNATTGYSTIAAAFTAANSKSFATVKMLADATVGETLTIDTGKNITLNLNGHKLEHTDASGSVIKVNGTFTLNDSNKTTSHDITSPVTNQSVTIKGGLITGGKGYGDSVIGGAIYVDGGSFTMSGGTLAGNMADYGGGVRVGTNATFIMNENATISHNKATKDGGGICVCGATKVELKGTVSENAAFAGGGIYYEGNGTHIISGATIKNNTVTTDSGVDYSGNGGGIYVDKCTVIMSTGSISGNSTTKNGGGVYVTSGSTFEMTNGAISGNKADYAGGVCINDGVFTMSGGTINGNNTKFIFGGGGVLVTDGTFNVSGGAVIKDNVKSGTLDQSTGLYTGETKNNVYLAYEQTITVTGALTTGAIIGVYNSGDVATGYNQSEKPSVFFKADYPGCCASASGGTVSIGVHTGGTATCVAAKICTNCGESYGLTNSSNHTYGTPSYTWSSDNSTCTAERVCTSHSNSKEIETVTATSVTTAQTCTVGGYDTLTATFTNPAFATQTKQINQTNATGHTPEADDNDCTTEIKCSVCQDVTTSAQTHDFTSSYTSDGTQHWHVCAHSGCTQTDTKTNHNYHQEVANNTYFKTAATCTAKAVYYKSCVCGFAGTETFESGAPIGHDWATQFTVDKQASCTEKGSKSKHCSRCSEKTEVTEIEMTAHPYGDWQTVTAATCSAVGSKKHICSACNHAELGTIDIDPTAHSFNNWIGEVASNCTDTGTKAHKDCNLCGKHFDSDGVEITDLTIATNDNHAWNDGEVTTDPTCTDEGVKTFTCTRTGCGHTKPESVAALGHTEVTDNAVAPTCTAKGKTEGKHCSVCNIVITVQTEVAVLGHDYATEFTVDKQPTVSEKGSKSKHCSRCEEKTEITEIDMLKAELVKPDENGGEVDEVVVSIPSGFTPDIELVVTEIKEDSYAPQYEVIAESANGVIELVYDVTLKSDGVTVQPDGMLTIKLRIPENLKGKEFKLFHLHENTATDMEYTINGHYVVVNVDELSEFIFVGEKALPKLDKGDGNTVWLVLIIIMAILILCEIAYVLLRKTGKIKFEGGK